jgi:hypothetical protein
MSDKRKRVAGWRAAADGHLAVDEQEKTNGEVEILRVW